MDFFAWWFGYHWIISTLCSPVWQLLYSIWAHQPGMCGFALMVILIKAILWVIVTIAKER